MAGFTIHGLVANRTKTVAAIIRDASGLTLVVDRRGRIYSPDVKSGSINSDQVDIGSRALASLVRLGAITPEQARDHAISRMEAAFKHADINMEEIERAAGSRRRKAY